MKGIILAGGSGTRLYPVTLPVCKQLLPIYNKPMIYYPLSVLMLSDIRDVLIISTSKDIGRFKDIFGDGSHLGVSISYTEQQAPKGIAEALIISEHFLNGESTSLILGDNFFFGHGLPDMLKSAKEMVNSKGGAVVFGYYVDNPERYGVVEIDDNGSILSLEEKPEHPKSNIAVTGLYFYDEHAPELAKHIKPSWRGELEITDLNRMYLERGKLKGKLLGRGFAWLDTGTHDGLLEASEFVAHIEKKQGLKIGCIEEIAYRMGYINKNQLLKLAKPMVKSGYGEYLIKIAEGAFDILEVG